MLFYTKRKTIYALLYYKGITKSYICMRHILFSHITTITQAHRPQPLPYEFSLTP